MKRKMDKFISGLILTAILAGGMFMTAGCGVVEALLATFVSLIGAQPAADFTQTGKIEFNMLPTDGQNGNVVLGSLSQSGMGVKVKNDDGTYSDCKFEDEETKNGSLYNSLVMLIDESGSMGNEYPPQDYDGDGVIDDICPTCPHDPSKLRGTATGELISVVLAQAPQSQISVRRFLLVENEAGDVIEGPTDILVDFTSDPVTLRASLDQLDGTEMAGTPLWDSLAENIQAVEENGRDIEGTLQTGQSAKRYIVVLSDGDDRDSTQYNLDTVINLARSNNVVVHAIGLGPASASYTNPLLSTAQLQEQIETVTNLQTLAEKTGGVYASVNDPTALTALYNTIASSMVNGYQKETYSCQPKDSSGTPKVPTRGEKVEGTINFGGRDQVWSIIAP